MCERQWLVAVTYPEFESQLWQMAMSQGMGVVKLSVCVCLSWLSGRAAIAELRQDININKALKKKKKKKKTDYRIPARRRSISDDLFCIYQYISDAIDANSQVDMITQTPSTSTDL